MKRIHKERDRLLRKLARVFGISGALGALAVPPRAGHGDGLELALAVLLNLGACVLVVRAHRARRRSCRRSAWSPARSRSSPCSAPAPLDPVPPPPWRHRRRDRAIGRHLARRAPRGPPLVLALAAASSRPSSSSRVTGHAMHVVPSSTLAGWGASASLGSGSIAPSRAPPRASTRSAAPTRPSGSRANSRPSSDRTPACCTTPCSRRSACSPTPASASVPAPCASRPATTHGCSSSCGSARRSTTARRDLLPRGRRRHPRHDLRVGATALRAHGPRRQLARRRPARAAPRHPRRPPRRARRVPRERSPPLGRQRGRCHGQRRRAHGARDGHRRRRGFEPDAVDGGRLGYAESVVGRLNTVGGRARIFSSPGSGTTVMLEVPKP